LRPARLEAIALALRYRHDRIRERRQESSSMAKGQMKSNKEARKPKKAKVKTIAANPSTKGSGGLSKD